MSDCGELIERSDHSDQAISRLISQFECAENFHALIRAFVDQITELEGVAFDLLNQIFLCDIDSGTDQAEGIYLDRWGEALGVPRDGRTDEHYRRALKSRFLCLISQGTWDDMRKALDAYTGEPDKVFLQEFPNGYFEVFVEEGIMSDYEFAYICELINGCRPAATHWSALEGVGLPDEGFRFAVDSNVFETSTSGFATDSVTPVDGGVFLPFCGTPPRPSC